MGMMVELECLEPLAAESVALKLLATEAGGKFHRVFDRGGSRNESCVLIKMNGEYVGFATVTSDCSSCEIYRFFIVPVYRSMGVGTLAAQQLYSLLREESFDCCYLQIDDARTYRFWTNALGSLETANETANMYRKYYL